MKLFIAFGIVFALPGVCAFGQSTKPKPKMEMKVPKDMLVWQLGTTYETTLRYSFVAHDLTYHGTANDKPVSGEGSKAISYIGMLKYRTQLLGEDSNAQQGRALRTYEFCQAQNLLGDVSLDFSPGFMGKAAHFTTHWLKGSWFDWMSFSYPGEGTAYDVTGKGADGAVTCKFRREFLEREAAPCFDLMEYIPELRNRAYFLTWDTPAGAKSGTLDISCAERVPSGEFVETGETPPPVLKDVINRETSMLYGAVYDGQQRKPNEKWVLDGKVLGGLIHPSLKAGFSGRVVVQASSQYQSHPPIERYGRDVPESYNASKVGFLAGGKAGNEYAYSHLSYNCDAQDGGKCQMDVDFSNGGVTGDFWIDTDRLFVRHAFLKCNNVPYHGMIPKIGDISVNAEVGSAIGLEMQYDCKPVKDMAK